MKLSRDNYKIAGAELQGIIGLATWIREELKLDKLDILDKKLTYHTSIQLIYGPCWASAYKGATLKACSAPLGVENPHCNRCGNMLYYLR